MKKIISLLLALSLLFSPCAWAKDLYRAQKPPVGSQIDWKHPLSRGLVGCWLMNEGGGKVTKNLINKRASTLSSNLYFSQSGIYSPGDSANDTINSGDILNMVLNDLTIVFMVKLPAYDATRRLIIKRIPSANQVGYDIYLNTPGNFNTSFARSALSTLNIVSTRRIDTNKILSLASVYNRDGNMKQYINGVEDGSVDISGSSTQDCSNTQNLYFGGTSAVSGYKGYFYHVYMYFRVLSPSEIQQLYIDPYCFIKQNYRLYAPAIAPPTAVFNSQIITVGW
jgi:hypothetical protein